MTSRTSGDQPEEVRVGERVIRHKKIACELKAPIEDDAKKLTTTLRAALDAMHAKK